MRLCRTRGWRPVVLAASPRAAVLWRRRTADHRALWAVPIGHDVVVDVAGFSMHGRSKRNLRQAVQRAHNAGLTTTVLPEADIDAALRAELLGVARNSGKSIDAERGFSMMLDGTLAGRYPGTWLVVARNRAGAVQGFQRYATAGGGAEATAAAVGAATDAAPAVARLGGVGLRYGAALALAISAAALLMRRNASRSRRTASTLRPSSNWRRADSFVGENYAFRPYFRAALAGGAGKFFAVGATTRVPGLSRPSSRSGSASSTVVGGPSR